MPLYEYVCASCGPFEVHRPVIAAGKSARCPACNARAGRQYIFNTSVGLAPVGPAPPAASLPDPSPIDGPNTQMGGVYLPHGGLDDVAIEGFGTGLTVPVGGRVRGRGLHFRGNRMAVDNLGEFDAPDTEVE